MPRQARSQPASQPAKPAGRSAAKPAKPAKAPLAGYMDGPTFRAARDTLGFTVADMAQALGYAADDSGPGSAGSAAVIRWQRVGPPVSAARLVALLLRGGLVATVIRNTTS